jgi:DivIVA domain-containing protein
VVYDQTAPSGPVESEPPLHEEIRDISFPVVVRGYDRRAVDAYVEHVNRVIAELEVSRSPQAAVRHALERVGEQTSAILQRARETAEEIIAGTRVEAEEFTARAKAEAAELVVNTSADADRMRAEAERFLATAKTEANQIVADARADADRILAHAGARADELRLRSEEELTALREQAEVRMRQLELDTEGVWERRHALLQDITGIAARLEEVASEAAARLRRPTEAAEEELLEQAVGDAGDDEPDASG